MIFVTTELTMNKENVLDKELCTVYVLCCE